MSVTYPDIVEKTFQEESFYSHRRFLPFWANLLAAFTSLRPIRGIAILLHGPTPRIL
jgi:hypothetical protein